MAESQQQQPEWEPAAAAASSSRLAPVLISVVQTQADLRSLSRWARRNLPSGRRVFWASVVGYGGCIVAMLVAPFEGAPVVGVLALVAALGTMLMQVWSVPAGWVGREIDYVADEVGLTWKEGGIVYRLDWNEIHRSDESDDYFVLAQDTGVVVPLPKRSFTSAEDTALFRKFAGR